VPDALAHISKPRTKKAPTELSAVVPAQEAQEAIRKAFPIEGDLRVRHLWSTDGFSEISRELASRGRWQVDDRQVVVPLRYENKDRPGREGQNGRAMMLPMVTVRRTTNVVTASVLIGRPLPPAIRPATAHPDDSSPRYYGSSQNIATQHRCGPIIGVWVRITRPMKCVYEPWRPWSVAWAFPGGSRLPDRSIDGLSMGATLWRGR